jgi:hypothetical protein
VSVIDLPVLDWPGGLQQRSGALAFQNMGGSNLDSFQTLCCLTVS